MNFDFSDSCKQIQAEVRRVLERVCTMTEVRRCLDQGIASASTWRALVDLGVVGAAVPERWGGSGLGVMELAVSAEEIGRACTPTPSLPSIYLATEALLRAGTDRQRERWLPLLANGASVGCVALAPAGLQRLDGRLSGRLSVVAAGLAADFIVIDFPDIPALVDLRQAAIRRQAHRCIDPGYPVAEIMFDQAAFEPLDGPLDGPLDSLVDHAAILLAFEQLGGADRALTMARSYATQRRAFGRTIASYQAVKHKLADVWVKNEIARGHAYYGAWALSATDPHLPLAAAAARVSASDAFEHAAQENVQVHGGFGFTWESDCHPLYKRARSSALALGSSLAWRRELTTRLHTARDNAS